MNGKKFLDSMGNIDDKYIEEANSYRALARNSKVVWLKLGAVACVCLAVGLVFLPKSHKKIDHAPKLEINGLAEESPLGMARFMNYNGIRYSFLENGSSYNIKKDQLGESLGVLEYDILANPEENSQKEFSSSFALGGEVLELKNYNPNFRVAVELDGSYYICQNNGKTDNTPQNVEDYFKFAEFPEKIESVSIYDHEGREKLADFPNERVGELVAELSKAKIAELTNDDFERIGKAQSNGKSFKLSFNLKDETKFIFYVIPSINITMIAGDRYILPKSFGEKFSEILSNLEQEILPEH